VTATTSPRDPLTPRGLAGKLMAVVRPEFRASELRFASDDPVFGGRVCRVSHCTRIAHGRGLCQGHHQRWRGEGRPDLESYLATTDPQWRRARPNGKCALDGCGYGVARSGLCALHAQRWHKAGRPDLTTWSARAERAAAPKTPCLIEHCDLWPRATSVFCHTHHNTWRVHGNGPVAEFAAAFVTATESAGGTITLEQLPPGLRLEIAYGLQCRSDERATVTRPTVVMLAVRVLAAAGAASLLEQPEEHWRSLIGPTKSNAQSFISFTYRKLEDLAEGEGWEAEYPRDRWRLRRLGFPGDNILRFDQIPQPVLRDLAKRWIRWRLASGVHLDVARRGIRALTRFAQFCDAVGIEELPGIDRALLERYLADLSAERWRDQFKSGHLGQLTSFFQAIRIHQWDQRLPATAMFFPDDHPQRPELPPRALSEQVMAQVEHPDNLARFTNPAYRLTTLILIRCGLRVSDALKLPPDCVVADSDGAPYLRYFNHKMKREALVPIDEELRALLDQQRAERASAACLFPRPSKNPDGIMPVSSSTYRLALYRWLEHCDVRDETRAPVHFTPHQWRHTLGTRLINRDVPQEVVRKILDHDSPLMTAHYANSRELHQVNALSLVA